MQTVEDNTNFLPSILKDMNYIVRETSRSRTIIVKAEFRDAAMSQIEQRLIDNNVDYILQPGSSICSKGYFDVGKI